MSRLQLCRFTADRVAPLSGCTCKPPERVDCEALLSIVLRFGGRETENQRRARLRLPLVRCL